MSSSAQAYSDDQIESSGSTTFRKSMSVPANATNVEQPKLPTSNRLASAFLSDSVSPPSKKHNCLKILQQFDGVVIKVDGAAREFEAELTDITHPGNPQEIIVVSIDDISPLDQELVREGALFQWTIGRKTIVNGMPSREGYDRFTFRRIPNWSKAKIEDARKQAQSLLDSLCQ
jgi:hypothetical protein